MSSPDASTRPPAGSASASPTQAEETDLLLPYVVGRVWEYEIKTHKSRYTETVLERLTLPDGRRGAKVRLDMDKETNVSLLAVDETGRLLRIQRTYPDGRVVKMEPGLVVMGPLRQGEGWDTSTRFVEFAPGAKEGKLKYEVTQSALVVEKQEPVSGPAGVFKVGYKVEGYYNGSEIKEWYVPDTGIIYSAGDGTEVLLISVKDPVKATPTPSQSPKPSGGEPSPGPGAP